MKIIDNKKDYYDYLSGIYGMDELAVYDRRGSVMWAQYKDRFPLYVDTRRVKDDLFIPEKRKRWWHPHRRFLCVEAGKRQYLFMAERILARESADEVEIRRSLLKEALWKRSIPRPRSRSSNAKCTGRHSIGRTIWTGLACGIGTTGTAISVSSV